MFYLILFRTSKQTSQLKGVCPFQKQNKKYQHQKEASFCHLGFLSQLEKNSANIRIATGKLEPSFNADHQNIYIALGNSSSSHYFKSFIVIAVKFLFRFY